MYVCRQQQQQQHVRVPCRMAHMACEVQVQRTFTPGIYTIHCGKKTATSYLQMQKRMDNFCIAL
jgi:ligand-binding sensor protein